MMVRGRVGRRVVRDGRADRDVRTVGECDAARGVATVRL
jgi:hypothetical protein